MDKELIEKCKLNPQELEAAARRGQSSVPSYGSGAAEHRSAEMGAVQEDLLLKANPIIQKAERERILKVTCTEPTVCGRYAHSVYCDIDCPRISKELHTPHIMAVVQALRG